MNISRNKITEKDGDVFLFFSFMFFSIPSGLHKKGKI